MSSSDRERRRRAREKYLHNVMLMRAKWLTPDDDPTVVFGCPDCTSVVETGFALAPGVEHVHVWHSDSCPELRARRAAAVASTFDTN